MRITPPDLELFLTEYVRAIALVEGKTVTVTNKEPSNLTAPLARPLIVIRDDSGQRLELPTFDRSVGVSVLGWSKQNDQPANDLARWLAAVLMDDAIVQAPGSPIASIVWDGCNGPYPITENADVARRYLTVEYITVGVEAS
ncbi:hypothetical protein SCB71_06315 [Herbiconiux sp. KACC 21604]|uniref:hypothetical protein n=1 Tax=unclassified Herbiconiux TaxID=2618217 RepID=UPI001490E623|nr:hypothetical protein [Herbiconiux sp. SALV-R1]QJU52932.1 hypothetical protein HL652_04300 [Herbiconiux sp. SALV-R1]WPO87852.1 hypothetical protein SCB71_06315 [Herbiconiux sp. KACC 21604]